MQLKSETARAEAIAEMRSAIAELEGETRQDYILAWTNGLGVAFNDPNRVMVRACDLTHAETIGTDDMPEDAWAFVPRVTNGHGEAASVVRRIDACRTHAVTLRGVLASLEAAQ